VRGTPGAQGDADGESESVGVCDGVTGGVAAGVEAGVLVGDEPADGDVVGVSDGETLGEGDGDGVALGGAHAVTGDEAIARTTPYDCSVKMSVPAASTARLKTAPMGAASEEPPSPVLPGQGE